jgi:hypothetical protein
VQQSMIASSEVEPRSATQTLVTELAGPFE